jgi:hypothetical protein
MFRRKFPEKDIGRYIIAGTLRLEVYKPTDYVTLIHNPRKRLLILKLTGNINDHGEKRVDATDKTFPDPYAPKPRDLHTSITHALLATALFRCW